MMKIKLRLSEVPLHLFQPLAGFETLRKAGKIDLQIERLQPDDPAKLPFNMFEAVMPDGKRLIYDMNDGYRNLLGQGEDPAPFYDALLARCDLLFKRSFDAADNARFCAPEKMRRTPPNFQVTVHGNPAHWPTPCDPRADQIKKLLRMLPGSQYWNGHVLENKMFSPPHMSEKPKILFMARLWDPAGEFPGQLTESMRQERDEINLSRAACIRALRSAFGDQCCCGVAPSPYVKREFADIILETPGLSRKDAYLAFMKQFDIHIATMGLHRSTGWKFAEYLAASKAIVCETLRYESAGDLREGTHYFAFDDPDGCVRQVQRLLDADVRCAMMQNNHEYAEQYMRCGAFVRTTLEEAGYGKDVR